MEGAANPMLASITDALSTVISWFGTVMDAIIGTDGALNDAWPLLAVGIAISLVLLGIKVVRKFAWGA